MSEPPERPRNTKRIICTDPKCMEKFNRQKQLDDHIKQKGCVQEVKKKRAWKKRTFPCIVCKEIFKTSSLKEEHERNLHDLVKPERKSAFVCPICEETGFMFRRKLRDHLKTKHNWESTIITNTFSSYESKYRFF